MLLETELTKEELKVKAVHHLQKERFREWLEGYAPNKQVKEVLAEYNLNADYCPLAVYLTTKLGMKVKCGRSSFWATLDGEHIYIMMPEWCWWFTTEVDKQSVPLKPIYNLWETITFGKLLELLDTPRAVVKRKYEK